MAKINFDVTTNTDEVTRLREEIEKLKQALQGFDATGDLKGFDELNKKYQEATEQLKKYEQEIAGYQRIMEQMNLSSGVADSARKITSELNNATDVFVEQQIRVKDLDSELRNLNKTYLKLSDVDRKSESGQALLNEIKQKTAARQAEAQVLKDLKKAYTDNIKMEDAAADSLVALRLQLSALTKEYDRLSAADRSSDIGSGLQKQIAEITEELNKAEQATGRFQRNVGNYASSWNGLGVSVQQVARELPSLAVSANTFFLAISNNLPMLADELKKASAEYKAFQAAVKAGQTDVAKVAPVWKQLASAVFSWQTALVVAITALSVYGKEITSFVKNLFSAGESLKSTKELQNDLNKAFSESTDEVAKQIVEFKKLQSQWKELGGNIEEQQKFIEKNEQAFNSMGVSIKSARDAENLFVDNTDNFIQALKLRAEATAAQDLAAEEYKKAIQKEIEADKKREKAAETREKKELDFTSAIQDTRFGNVQSQQQLVEERARTFENEAAAAEKDAEAIRKNAGAYFELGRSREDAADALLSESGIEKYDQYEEEKTKKAKEEAEKSAEEQKEVQEKLYQQLLELRMRNQESEISLMDEGTEKKLAKINLEYDKAIAELKKREQEWRDAQAGQLTTDQEKEIRTSYITEYIKKMKSENKVETDEFSAEREAMNEYLKEYGTFQQKLTALKEEYDAKRAKTTNKYERMTLAEEYKKEMAAIQTEANKGTNAVTQLFTNMKERTLQELLDLSERGAEALKFLQSGVWDGNKGIELGITKEQFELWSQSPEKLKDISDALNDVQQNADNLRPAFDKVSEGIKRFFNAGDDAKKLEEALKLINSGVSEITSSVGFLSDTFSKLGDSFGGAFSGIADGLNIAMDAVNSAMSGATAGSMFGPIGASAGAAIGVVTSLASAIAGIHDKKVEKNIDALQDQIDLLDSSYEKLGRSIEKAYSTDASKMIGQQNELLEQQKLLIQQQIEEEQSKKKVDDDRIREWKEQIDEINAQIEDNVDKAKEAISGISFDSFRDSFLESLSDMDSSAEDFAADFESLLQKSILNSLIANKYDQKIKQLYNRWAQLGEDGLSTSEVEALQKEQQAIVEQMIKDRDELANIFGWKDELEEAQKEQQTATAGGFETMSQDSADELNGRFTALQITGEELLYIARDNQLKFDNIAAGMESVVMSVNNMYAIADENRAITVNCYMELQQINDNTANAVKQLKEAVTKLSAIQENTNRL